MSRFSLFTLALVFAVSGLAVSLSGGAHADPSDRAETFISASTAEVERCSLQPRSVAHPDHGIRVLVLERSC